MYKQVTPEQLEIWLNDPVTMAYLDCMEFCRAKLVMETGSGKYVDPQNNDLTCYNTALSIGKQAAFTESLNPAEMLGNWERQEVANG